MLRGLWDLPRSAFESVSTTLVGGFFTTELQGNSHAEFFNGVIFKGVRFSLLLCSHPSVSEVIDWFLTPLQILKSVDVEVPRSAVHTLGLHI